MKELPAIKLHCLTYTKKTKNGLPKVWRKIPGSSISMLEGHSDWARRVYPDLPNKETWIINLNFYSN